MRHKLSLLVGVVCTLLLCSTTVANAQFGGGRRLVRTDSLKVRQIADMDSTVYIQYLVVQDSLTLSGPLTANWDAGAQQIRALQFYADVDGATSGFKAGASGDVALYRWFADTWQLGADDALIARLESKNTGLGIYRYNDTPANGPGFDYARFRGSIASPAAVQSGDVLGQYVFYGYDGDSSEIAAQIRASVDDSVSDGIVPSRISFLTTSTAGAISEGLRIDSNQNTSISTHKLIGGTLGSETVEFYQGASDEWWVGIDNRLVLRLESIADTFIHRRANDTAAEDAHILFNRSKGTLASPTDVFDGTYLGSIVFEGYEGTPYAIAAQIRVLVDGTTSSGVVPGEIRIITANSGGSLSGCARFGADQDFYLGANIIKWGTGITASDVGLKRWAAGKWGSTSSLGVGASPTEFFHVTKNQEAATRISVTNTTATGTGTFAGVKVEGASADVSVRSHGTARIVTRYGITVADYGELISVNGEGLLIGTGSNDKPIIFGSNNTEVVRMTGAECQISLALHLGGDLNHDGTNVGFYTATPVAQQTGVAVTAAGIHAALVNLGLIAP